jgi:hypothetical protein
MKINFFYLLISGFIFLNLNTLVAQKYKSEIGIFAGTSYYLGDINPITQFYMPLPSIGLLYKYNINDREVVSLRSTYGQLQGNDRYFSDAFQQKRNASFSATLIDVNALYEFNFFPFHFHERRRIYSPYLMLGLGYEVVLSSVHNNPTTQDNIPNHFSVPFGIGIKYMLTRRTTVGAEWSFRKTFIDQIDGVTNPGGNQYKSVINNNDWY